MDHSHHAHHGAHDATPKPDAHAHHHMDHGSHDVNPTYEVVTKAVTSLVNTIISTVMPEHNHGGHHEGHDVHMGHDMHESDSAHDMHNTHFSPGVRADHGSHVGHGTHGSHGDHTGHHATYFHNKYDMAVLFEEWTIDTKTGIFLLFLFTVILAICYQGIKWVRTYLHSHYRDRKHTLKSKEHLVQTVLYGAEFFVSYILMLVVMTYNIWVLVLTIIGLGLGYFLFGLHQPKECAPDCPNMSVEVSVDERNRNYDKEPSASELVPLGSGAELCEPQCCEFKTVKETDILI